MANCKEVWVELRFLNFSYHVEEDAWLAPVTLLHEHQVSRAAASASRKGS